MDFISQQGFPTVHSSPFICHCIGSTTTTLTISKVKFWRQNFAAAAGVDQNFAEAAGEVQHCQADTCEYLIIIQCPGLMDMLLSLSGRAKGHCTAGESELLIPAQDCHQRSTRNCRAGGAAAAPRYPGASLSQLLINQSCIGPCMHESMGAIIGASVE
jgi:hypothetical protein